MEVTGVGLGELLQVCPVDRPFVVDSAPHDSLQQRVYGGLQVDDEVGYRRVHIELRADLFVQGHLLPVEVYFREQAILREVKVGNADG